VLVIALAMIAILVLAALVVTYAAFPHRGEEVPAAPWLGDAMAKAAEATPTIPGEPADDRDPAHRGIHWTQA
jgi:hypothetical protein